MRNLRFWSVLAVLVLGVPLGAQNLAEDVLRGTPFAGIEFRNYEGPHRVIEPRAAIQGIGADLGRQMAVNGVADYAGKYRVQRIHDPASDRLSADLFVLEVGAGVDHIRNLNWIVASYLQAAFGYSAEDADLLANFVTRYNGYYRGKMDYVGQAFIPAVGAAVTAETLGLSLLWSDWPGKTRMLIPLRDSLSKGLGGSINTEEISNKEVVTQMAQEPGKGIEERKALADLKEAEIVQEQKAVAQAEVRASAPPGTSAVGPSTAAPQTPNPAVASPGTPPASTTTTPAPTTPDAKASEAAKTLPLEEAKKDLAARDAALQAERQDIVKEETNSPPAPAAPAKPAVTVAVVHMNEASKLGQVWLVDPAANKVWKKSPLNTVRQNQAPAFGPGLLVVAGDERAPTGAVRLVLVSKDDASVVATGADDVAPIAPVIRGNLVLTLVKDPKAGWVLGAFDQSLKLVVRGTDALSPLSAVVPAAGGLLVQGASGALLLLEEPTLKKKSDTEG